MVVVARLLAIAVVLSGAALGVRPPTDPVDGSGSAAAQGTRSGSGTTAPTPAALHR